MKIKCEIDVEWIGEDESVDEVVQRKLIDAVAKNLSAQTIKNIQTEATKELFAQVHDRINALLESFLDKPVFITDNYGDTKAKYESVSEMLKDRFDNFLTQKVDGSGNVSDSCSYNKYTRLEYFIEQIVQKKADAATTKIAQDIGRQVDEIINKMMKEKISTVLVNKLDLKGMLAKL